MRVGEKKGQDLLTVVTSYKDRFADRPRMAIVKISIWDRTHCTSGLRKGGSHL